MQYWEKENSSCHWPFLQTPSTMFWALFGKFIALLILAKAICFIWATLRSFLFPLFGWRINYKSYGEWAVITGATDGIGKAYAMELARMGLKTVLISRTQEKLDQVAKEISDAHHVETRTICFDFSASTGYEKIESEIRNLNISVLVNNVGMVFGYPEYFGLMPIEKIEDMINVNIISAVKMTHIVLKGMLESYERQNYRTDVVKEITICGYTCTPADCGFLLIYNQVSPELYHIFFNRQKGILIHVSSSGADQPIPFFNVYAAAKVFVDYFARALQMEYRSSGIISQSLAPFYVTTKLSGVQAGLFTPNPTPYVKQALRTVGIADRSYGYITHHLEGCLSALIPDALKARALPQIFLKQRTEALLEMSKKDS